MAREWRRARSRGGSRGGNVGAQIARGFQQMARAMGGVKAPPRLTTGTACFMGFRDGCKAGLGANFGGAGGGLVANGDLLAAQLDMAEVNGAEHSLLSNPSYRAGFAAGQTFLAAAAQEKSRQHALDLVETMDTWLEKTNALTGSQSAGSGVLEEIGGLAEDLGF